MKFDHDANIDLAKRADAARTTCAYWTEDDKDPLAFFRGLWWGLVITAAIVGLLTIL